jgi:hypothetical protein
LDASPETRKPELIVRWLHGKKARLPRSPREPFLIPLFAESLAHSSIPLAGQAAVARSGGQGRP